MLECYNTWSLYRLICDVSHCRAQSHWMIAVFGIFHINNYYIILMRMDGSLLQARRLVWKWGGGLLQARCGPCIGPCIGPVSGSVIHN